MYKSRGKKLFKNSEDVEVGLNEDQYAHTLIKNLPVGAQTYKPYQQQVFYYHQKSK